MNWPAALILASALTTGSVLVWPLKYAQCGNDRCLRVTYCTNVRGLGLRCARCRRRARLASIARRLLGEL